MSGARERAPSAREDASPLALHLALWIPFAILVVLSWFTVVAPEIASERPPEPGERAAERAASAPEDRPVGR